MSDAENDEWCPRVDCYNLTTRDLEPNPDISGYGVIVGFLGTAYFVLFLVLVNYLIASDPYHDPFQNHPRNRNSTSKSDWRPNAVDERFLRWLRSKFNIPKNGSRRLRRAFNESIISMCDIQVVTGLGILISGYILLSCGLDAHHWQMAVYLAWFSTVTHMSGLTALRNHLNTHVWAKYIRFGLMFSLLVLLVVGVVPTGFFIYESQMSSPAVCYFNQVYGYWRFSKEYQEPEEEDVWSQRSDGAGHAGVYHVEDSQAWQAMLFSVILLVFGFGTRSVKLFQPLSRILMLNIRQPMSDWAKRVLTRLGSPGASRSQLGSALWTKLVFNPVLSIFFMIRLSVDVYSSTLFEIYWLWVILLWGSAKLFGARNSVSSDLGDSILRAENLWTFGQILPVILLIGPLFSTIGSFVFHLTAKRPATLPNDDDDDLLGLDNAGHREINPEYSTSGPRTQNSGFIQDIERDSSPGAAGRALLPSPETHSRLDMDLEPGDVSRSPATQKFEVPHLQDYGEAPWFTVCVAFVFLGILAATMIAFGTVVNFGVRWDAQWSLYELWVSKFGFIYLLLISYPSACTITIRLGIGMEDWFANGRMQWLFFRICGGVYFLNLVFVVLPLSGVRTNDLIMNWPFRLWGGFMVVGIMYTCHALAVCGIALKQGILEKP